jgi:nucleolar protein 56
MIREKAFLRDFYYQLNFKLSANILRDDVMKLYLVEHALGSFGYDESGNLLDFVPLEKDIGKVSEYLINNEKGEPLPSTVKLLEKLKPEEVVVENEAIVPAIQKLGYKVKVEVHHVGAKSFRESMAETAVSRGLFANKDEVYNYLYSLSFEYTRRKIRGEAQKRDLLAIQTVRAIDDIDKTINLFSERLREWYSIHFPELDKLVEDHETYAKIVNEVGLRENFTESALKELGINEDLAKRIVKAAKNSIGADISEVDAKALGMLSSQILNLYAIRREFVSYLESVMKEVAPNVTALVGPTIGARLLSLAGSLEDLAKLPASTIQVLGAEKALFRALRKGGKPPKHGIIFQYPEIHGSPRWQRGKIARALAAKLAIAARVDYFSGRYIGDKLNEELKKRIEEIKTKYASPPPRRPEAVKRPEEKAKEKKEKKGKSKEVKGKSGEKQGGKGR